MLSFKKTNFNKTIRRLEKLQKLDVRNLLENLGKEGVRALSLNTPVDSGETASSWRYNVEITNGGYRLVWENAVMANRVPLVVLLQLGHGTRDGHYIPGKDFINPALDPLYDKFQISLRKEVKR